MLVISTPQDLPRFNELLGDGSQWGMNISCATQDAPRGLAESFIIGRSFIGDGPSALVLGDNIFYGNEFVTELQRADGRLGGASVFAYHVHDPERYGVVEFDANGRALSIEEKPAQPPQPLRGHGALFLRRARLRFRGGSEAVGAGRARDHRRQPLATSTKVSSTSRSSGAATPGSTPERTTACSRRQVHCDAAEAAGPHDRLSRGDRLRAAVDRRRTTATTRGAAGEDQLRAIPARVDPVRAPDASRFRS